MEHVLVWETLMEKYQGHQIHHQDGNKLNNNISNLELVDTLTHKRIQSGCELEMGNGENLVENAGELNTLIITINKR